MDEENEGLLSPNATTRAGSANSSLVGQQVEQWLTHQLGVVGGPQPADNPPSEEQDLEVGAAPGAEETQNAVANGGQLGDLDVDIQGVSYWLEQTLPFVFLLTIVFCSHHFIGIGCFLWLTSVLKKCNDIMKQQSQLWAARSTRKVMDVVTTLALNALCVYFVFRDSYLWHRLLCLPLSDPSLTVWMALWTVITNDIMIRYAATLVKCGILLYSGIRPQQRTSQSRKRQVFALVDQLNGVYRILTPVPVWYFYFMTVINVPGMLLAGLYLAMKLASITERFKFLTMVITSMTRGESMYGKYATTEELESAQDCSICQGPMQDAIILPCAHLFCEECVSEWLQREPTCPLCRAQVGDKECRLHGLGDGTAPLLPQVF